jgi:Caspase domain
MWTEPVEGRDFHAVLIGVSAYEHAEFPPVPAARNSVQAMKALLSDPALCGWLPDQISVIMDPVSASDVAAQIADLAESITGVLLLYYVGHGALSTRGELCLTVTSTRLHRPKITGLTWETLADVLRECPARVRVAILDCCFAGQAIEALAGSDESGLADMAHVEGVYTLTATTRNRAAHVPPSDQQNTSCTSFTGELRDLIRIGIPGRPAVLTLGDIYPALRQRLKAKGMPVPNQRGTDTAYKFPFSANAAVQTVQLDRSPSEEVPVKQADRENLIPVQVDLRRAMRLLGDAEDLAHSIANESSRAWSLADVADVMAATDPGRAIRLLAEAEDLTHSIADEGDRAWKLMRIAEVMAAADSDRATRLVGEAEDLALSITDESSRATIIGGLAKAAAASDSDLAERLANSIEVSEYRRTSALEDVAKVIAVRDPERAERLARTMEARYSMGWVLKDVALVVAATDPDRAERLADSIHDEYSRAEVLIRVVAAVAPTDPRRAIRILGEAEVLAHRIWGDDKRIRVLARIAELRATTDPGMAIRILGEAEDLAQTITDESKRDWALCTVASAMATTDLDRAEQLAYSIGDKISKSSALSRIAYVMAATDPDRAEHIVRSKIFGAKESKLSHFAKALAATDPDRAERVARTIPGEFSKTSALLEIAKVLIQGRPV